MSRTESISIRGSSMPRNRCFHHIMMKPCFDIDFAPYEHVFYDESRKFLILIQYSDSKRPMYFTLSLKQAIPKLSAPIEFINSGDVITVRFSASKRFLAIQRSDIRVDIVDLLHKTELELNCRYKATNRLIRYGLIWAKFEKDTEALYLVTQRGIEVYRITTSTTSGTTCKHMRTIKQKNVSRFWFSPTRVESSGDDDVSSVGICVLGAGTKGKTLCPFVLSSYSPLRVPKFEMTITSTFNMKQLRVACIYDHMYCIHLQQKQNTNDKTPNVCKLYHIAKDGVTLAHILPLYTNATSSLSLQIVDNLIIIHDTSTQCSMIFDLKYVTPSSSSSSKTDTKKRIPIVNPLMVGMDISISVPSVRAWIKPKIAEFEVIFQETGPLGLELMWPGAVVPVNNNKEGKQEDDAKGQHRPTIVCGFHRTSSGDLGPAEKCGKIRVGDHLIAVNGEPTMKRTFQEVLEMIKKSDRPLCMKFREWGRYDLGSINEQDQEEVDTTTTSSSSSSSSSSSLQTQCCKAMSKLKRYAETWQYLWPGWILDKNTKSRSGKLWRIEIRLADIVRSKASDPYFVVPFLQRRAVTAADDSIKTILLTFVRNLICENAPLHTICYVFTLINKVLRAWNLSCEKKSSSSAATTTTTSTQQDSKRSEELKSKRPIRTENGLLVVTMQEMYEGVFLPVSKDDRVRDSDAIKVILEYMRNLQFYRTTPLPCLFELVAQILVRSERYHTLYQYMQYHLHQDTARIAQIAYDASSEYKPLGQIAMDIWSRLGHHEHTVCAHLRAREIVAAMHVVLRHPKSFATPNKKLLQTFFFHTVERISRRHIPGEVMDRMGSLPDIRRLRVFLNRWYGEEQADKLNSDVLELLQVKKDFFSEKTLRFMKVSAMGLLSDHDDRVGDGDDV